MKFDLLDNAGKEIEHQRYLLSLKDMCQVDNLEELIEAGVCSFKIEGRLKDISYVKNVTAVYSERLNQIIRRFPEKYQRSSYGKVNYGFQPSLNKTFNRGYTDYFAHGRQPNIGSFDTPKSIGEYVGLVKNVKDDKCMVVSSIHTFSNGEGLCFINKDRELCGFRVNRVEGNHLYLLKVPYQLQKGMKLYRNNDMAFERQLLSKDSARRKIPVEMQVGITSDGISLKLTHVPKGVSAEASINVEHQIAQKSQS
jgi:putative protease